MKRIAAAVVVLSIFTGLAMFRFSSPALRFPYATGSTRSPTPVGYTESMVDGLRTIQRAPTATDSTWLVFFPGNDEHQLTTSAAFLNRVAKDRGVATLAYRGFDGSEGTPSPAALRADAVKFVEALKIAPAQLELVAFSLGTSLAVHVAAELSRRGTPPARLTILAGAVAISMLHASAFARVLRGDVYEISVDDAKAVRCPVRVIHGADDTTLPPSKDVSALLGAELTLLNGVDHPTILSRVELTP